RDRIDRDGMDAGEVNFRFLADLRYVGQEHALAIAVEGPAMLMNDIVHIRDLFHREHEQRYGQAAIEEDLEIVAMRLVLTSAREDSLAEDWIAEPWQAKAAMPEETRDVIFADAGKPEKARVYWRPSLAACTHLSGPAVIEEPNSTILIHPGDEVTVTETGHLVIDVSF
ncbi:MAG TPA: hypothetical protein VG271_03240, partial [Beijerinckiaceae bacterium]|nr:hypothetical protein [Beijerinckiaceae bacterium]